MFHVKSFCGCLPLKTGSTIIGILWLIGKFVCSLFVTNSLMDAIREDREYSLIVLFLALCIISVIFSVMFLIGIGTVRDKILTQNWNVLFLILVFWLAITARPKTVVATNLRTDTRGHCGGPLHPEAIVHRCNGTFYKHGVSGGSCSIA